MTDIKNPDRSASPVENCISDASGDYTGLTKRETFAMAAMQGLCANQYFVANHDGACEEIALNAKSMADTLLAELSK